MRPLRPSRTAWIYGALLTGTTAVLLVFDAGRLFQYITYVPAFVAIAIVAVVGLLLLGRTDPLPNRKTTLVLAALTLTAFVGVAAAPALPTSKCKAFYAAQRRLQVGMPLEAAYRALRRFDDSPPYAPSQDGVSFRCQSDPSTVDYVMIQLAGDGRTIASLAYLVD